MNLPGLPLGISVLVLIPTEYGTVGAGSAPRYEGVLFVGEDHDGEDWTVRGLRLPALLVLLLRSGGLRVQKRMPCTALYRGSKTPWSS